VDDDREETAMTMANAKRRNKGPFERALCSIRADGIQVLRGGKAGEYEHNLRILAQYLTGELKQEEPEAAHFARMVRRVERVSRTDLKVRP
jgi:hypothetical protein